MRSNKIMQEGRRVEIKNRKCKHLLPWAHRKRKQLGRQEGQETPFQKKNP